MATLCVIQSIARPGSGAQCAGSISLGADPALPNDRPSSRDSRVATQSSLFGRFRNERQIVLLVAEPHS